MTSEQLKEILEKHKKWLNNEDDGIRANLRGVNLIGANLYNADLSNANLRSANLRSADLIGANLYNADLSNANLSNVDLRGANLNKANLIGAIGNNKEVKSLQLGKYNTTMLVGIKIHIGCKVHTIEEWENFTDEEISKMDDGALDWWNEWKEVILKVAKGE